MKKKCVAIPQTARILNQKRMSNISGGNNPCPEGLIYDSSLNMCIHSGGGYFRCHCTVPNPPYVGAWEKYYDKTSDMYDDLREMCMISGGCNRI